MRLKSQGRKSEGEREAAVTERQVRKTHSNGGGGSFISPSGELCTLTDKSPTEKQATTVYMVSKCSHNFFVIQMQKQLASQVVCDNCVIHANMRLSIHSYFELTLLEL